MAKKKNKKLVLGEPGTNVEINPGDHVCEGEILVGELKEADSWSFGYRHVSTSETPYGEMTNIDMFNDGTSRIFVFVLNTHVTRTEPIKCQISFNDQDGNPYTGYSEVWVQIMRYDKVLEEIPLTLDGNYYRQSDELVNTLWWESMKARENNLTGYRIIGKI